MIFDVEPEPGGTATPAEKRHSTWLRISTDGKETKITLRRLPRLKRLQGEHTIAVSDFLTAVKIARMILRGVDYSYIEIDRESYRIGNCIVSLVQWPYMQSELEIEGPSAGEAHALLKLLGVKGSFGANLNEADVHPDMYYRLRGYDFEMTKKQSNKKLEKMLQE